jgi:nucleotide-binding universal stress UspA family protein
MAIRKVLLPLISTGAGEAALSTAWTVAQLWNAHMVVLHVQMDLAPAPAMSAMFQRFTVEHRVKVTEAPAGAESATASFLILTGRKLDILPQQARLVDLTVVRHPATPEEVSSSDILHAVLFDSGRPLLIAPQLAPTTVGRRTCLGLNGSAESAAAVEAAMPWLQRAEAVRILWAEEYQRRGPQAQELQTHLAMQGVPADLRMFKPVNNIVGAGLLAAAKEFNCDLLAMGAYAHSTSATTDSRRRDAAHPGACDFAGDDASIAGQARLSPSRSRRGKPAAFGIMERDPLDGAGKPLAVGLRTWGRCSHTPIVAVYLGMW